MISIGQWSFVGAFADKENASKRYVWSHVRRIRSFFVIKIIPQADVDVYTYKFWNGDFDTTFKYWTTNIPISYKLNEVRQMLERAFNEMVELILNNAFSYNPSPDFNDDDENITRKKEEDFVYEEEFDE